MCKVYARYHGTSEIEHGLCPCIVDNPLAKARGLSLRTGAQTMLYLSLVFQSPSQIFHRFAKTKLLGNSRFFSKLFFACDLFTESG